MTQKLPENVLNFIERYFNLHINNHVIKCPYFINHGGFLKPPVYAGKGTPDEIEKVANIVLGQDNLSNDAVLEKMHEKGIGIDCSGLVYQIYDFWLLCVGKNSLREFLPTVPIYNFRKYISRMTKPQNSIGANEFTSEPFSRKINLTEISPGDLIRTRGGKHLLFITEVEKKDGIVKYLKFVNSARQYKRDGVRYGEIYFGQDQNLTTARWDDNDLTEQENWTYKGYRESINNNGFFRPNIPIFVD